jgi:transcription antitermination factor NusG
MFPQIQSQASDDCWYVVHCRPGKEFLAESLLRESLGVLTYLPVVLSTTRGTTRKVPFFPGYLFLSATPMHLEVTHIQAMPGVVRLLDFGNGPNVVPNVVVNTIMERLENLNAQGGLPEHNFKQGDKVHFKSGPFRGLHAIFVGSLSPSARVKVLLEFLGRLNEVKVDVQDLSPTDNNPSELQPARHRGTRGHGRAIKHAQG